MEDIGQQRTKRRSTRALRLLAAASLATASVSAIPVSAQFGETAEVARPIPSTNSLDPTAAGSEIQIRDRIVAQTTEQLLLESAGTRVVATGGSGTPFCLRLRGAACDQVSVMLGDVPLSGPDTGTFDLSLVPLEAVEGFEVFRGGTPAWLNEGAVGGVLRLLPRTYEENEVGARGTYGSFGTWRANLFGAGAGEKAQVFATAGGAGSRNDYPYTFDVTPLDPTDNFELRRQNADFLEGFGFANLDVDTSDTSGLNLVFLGLGRDRGAPGPGSVPTSQARAKTARLIGTASWLQEKKGSHPYRVQVIANYDYGRNRFIDDLGEVGNRIPQRTNNQSHTFFGRAAASVNAVRWLEITTIASARYQVFDPQAFDPASGAERPTRSSDRVSAAGTLEARFFGDVGKVGLELRASVRLAWSRARIREAPLGRAPPPPSSNFLPTYRVGFAIAPIEWLAFRGSVASGYRLPSLLQLFGSPPTILPNQTLIPEYSISVDGAVTARGQSGNLAGYASVGGFVAYIDNLIRPRPVGQLVYENIESATSRGIEIELRGGVTEHFILQGELTWTQAIDNEVDRQLPGQPQLVAFAQPEAHSGTLSNRVSDIMAFFQVAYIGRSYSDRVSLVEIRARTVLALGAGVDLFESRLGLSFRVDDLLDVRGFDLLNFPLPGRRYTGRVTFRHQW